MFSILLASDGCGPSVSRGMVIRAAAPSEGARRALLIGNGSYEHFGALRNPTRDARMLHQTLSSLGFEVALVEDASRERLQGAIRRFAQSVNAGDIALIYYSGHGVSVGGHNYLVPVDFDGSCGPDIGAQLEERALSVDEMMTTIGGRQGRNVLLFDACRNNPCVAAARSLTRGLSNARSVGEGLASVRAPRDTMIVYATDPGSTADDGEGQNSPFALALRDHLPDPFDVATVVRRVRSSVAAATNDQQVPWTEESLRAELVLGGAAVTEAPGEARPAIVAVQVPARAPRVEPPVQTSSPPAAITALATVSVPACPSGMISIAGGDFTMGDAAAVDAPTRSAHVGSFCMDRTEVSVTSYRRCVTAGACTEPSPFQNVRGNYNMFCNWGRSGAETHPVNCVDWTQSTAYCMWAGGRLPTEEEWEYAARGREGRVWAWGNAGIDGTHANLCGDECSSYSTSSGFSEFAAYPGHHDEFAVTAPVDSLPAGATPEGLLNMTGNVLEWTSTVDGNKRVRRGGSWFDYVPSWVRAASRSANGPADRSHSIGFRCARGAR